MTTETARDLLARVESYLSALHGSVARHDQLAANLACAGCELRDQIAVELRRPAAVSVPPPAPRADDRAALRDRIRRAVCEAEGFGWDTDMLEPDEYGDAADAVLAVLPEAADQAAVLREAANALAAVGLEDSLVSGPRAWAEAIETLRRLADEATPVAAPSPPANEPGPGVAAVRALHRKASHGDTCVYCAHGQRLGYDTTWPCDTIRALDGDPQPVSGPCVAGEQQNETPEAATVHAVPLPGSNGISSCCGRPPCEFVGERVTRDPDKVTCTGPTAGVRQNGTQP